jgi:hypothetical protein
MKWTNGWIALAACAALCGAAPAESGDVPAEPPLLGPATAAQILAISPEWKSVHDAYEPGMKPVAAIREAAARGDLTIEVIFGSWCSDSRDQVPRLIKVLELAGPAIPVTFTGVPKAREERGERVAHLKLTGIPTVLVSRRAVEIGRISETPQASLEEDLAAIVAKP